jgi:hypothetical protein
MYCVLLALQVVAVLCCGLVKSCLNVLGKLTQIGGMQDSQLGAWRWV